MTVILVEGESDRAALEVVASRLGVDLPAIATINGASGVRAAAVRYRGEELIGLVDANEQREFEGVVPRVFVCAPDLEGELVRALGVEAVLSVIASQGELASFHRLQKQPAQRGRSASAQLRRFFAGRSGNKLRYARLLAAAIPPDRLPAPLTGLVRAAGLHHEPR
jgi:hypothetical protein